MKKTVKLTESELKRIIKNVLNEADSYGWVVDTSEAEAAYDLAVEHFGNEYVNQAIVSAMGNNALADCLAYLFRMWDFRVWEEYKDNMDE